LWGREGAEEKRDLVAKSNETDFVKSPDSEAPEKPVFILLAGAPGAGKTTFYESKLKSVFPTILRASSSPLEQTETNRERSRLQKEQQSFVYQDVIVDPRILQDARKAGFEVKVIYVATEDPNLNIGRVLIRVGQGGPFAALARVADDYAKGMKQLPEVKKHADDLMLFDNTTNGRSMRLVAHFRQGELVKLARTVTKWAQGLFGKEFDRWRGLQDRGHGRER
jgi:predicted ABC-type ATPase